MEYIQLSLFGKTLWERFHQTTGWILKPCWKHSQIPKFQCLLQEDGQMPAWCEGECLISAGGSWTPNIGEAPDCAKEESASFSWQILEEHAAQKYYLNPAGCSRILYLAQMAGTLPPKEIETILRKQGGVIPSSEPFMAEKCDRQQKKATPACSSKASEIQPTLFPHY